MKTNMKWLVAGIVASASLVAASAADADAYNYNTKCALIHNHGGTTAALENSMASANYSTKWALTAKRPGTETPSAYAAASYNSKNAVRGAAVEAIEVAPVK